MSIYRETSFLTVGVAYRHSACPRILAAPSHCSSDLGGTRVAILDELAARKTRGFFKRQFTMAGQGDREIVH